MERVDPPLSSLQVIHASAFSAGLVTLMAAALTSNPAWYLLSGPLLALSGALILVGWQVTFRGPIGNIMRAALGPDPYRRAITRGVVWFVIGVLVSAWGAVSLRRHEQLEHQGEPMVMTE